MAVPAPVPIYELSVTGATKILGETASTAADIFSAAVSYGKFFYDFTTFGVGLVEGCRQ